MPQEIRVPPDCLYLLTGEDEFRKRLALDRLKKKLLGDKPNIFNYELYYAKDSSAEEVIRSLKTPSLTGAKKLVVVKDPELFQEGDKARLIEYRKDLQATGNTLILFSKKSGTRDDKFISASSKYAKVLNFAPLKPDEISSWITAEFKARKKTINRKAAQLICDAAGQDLGRISFIIEQLSSFAFQRGTITEEDAEQFTEDVLKETSAFKLLDAINSKDSQSSLRILRGLLYSETNPSQIIGLLNWHISRLITIKRLLISRASKAQMLSYLSVGSYILGRLISQAENFNLAQLKKQLQALLDTDLMLKRSSVKGEFLLEMLVVKLSA